MKSKSVPTVNVSVSREIRGVARRAFGGRFRLGRRAGGALARGGRRLLGACGGDQRDRREQQDHFRTEAPPLPVEARSLAQPPSGAVPS